MQRYAMCRTSALRGDEPDFLKRRLNELETEDDVFKLLDQLSAQAEKEGDYSGARLESTINRITQLSHNPVITRALQRYGVGSHY